MLTLTNSLEESEVPLTQLDKVLLTVLSLNSMLMDLEPLLHQTLESLTTLL